MTEPDEARGRELEGLVRQVQALRATLDTSDAEAVQAYAEAIGRLLAARPDPAILEGLDLHVSASIVVRPDWDSAEGIAIRDALQTGDRDRLPSELLSQGLTESDVENAIAAVPSRDSPAYVSDTAGDPPGD